MEYYTLTKKEEKQHKVWGVSLLVGITISGILIQIYMMSLTNVPL